MGNMQLNHIRKIGDQVNNRSDIFMSSTRWTFGTLDFGTLELPPNSFYFLLHPFVSSYLLLSPISSWFGLLWGGGGSDDYGLEMDPGPLY